VHEATLSNAKCKIQNANNARTRKQGEMRDAFTLMQSLFSLPFAFAFCLLTYRRSLTPA
jgi:hypothetical protein